MIEKPIHHEVVPGLGWVPPDHPLHPDYDEVVKKSSMKRGEMREKIDGILSNGVYGWRNENKSIKAAVLDQIGLYTLTSEEATELATCFVNESMRRYGKPDFEAPLYLKLKRIGEWQ